MRSFFPASSVRVGCISLLVVCGSFTLAARAIAQPGSYAVTHTLNPIFIHPDTGENLTPEPLDVGAGLTRGADGFLYGMRWGNSHGDFETLAVIQINPTTGATKVIYVITESYISGFDFLRGREGRLYFSIRDGLQLGYAAPGHGWGKRDYASCASEGCVLYLDTVNSSVEGVENFYNWSPQGSYPYVHLEDTDGAIYVFTEGGAVCDDGWSESPALVKKALNAPYGEVTILERPWCEREGEWPYEWKFDWNTVTPSGNDIWHWSDGRTYFVLGQGVYQFDPETKTTVLLATIATGDGTPRGLSEGSGYLYGVTDGGGALGGGVVFRIRVPSFASPDLTVTALSPPPAFARPGQVFDVNDTTRNNATERAGTSITSYYLSRTGAQLDIRLFGSRYLPELGLLADSTGATSVTIPPTTALGTYWLVACADRDRTVPESSETNNCVIAASAVTVSRPDLVGTAVSNPPAFAQPGGGFSISDSVANEGPVSAGTFVIRYYLSLDAAKGTGDALLTGSRTVYGLGPSGTSTGSRAVTLPSATPLATYFILACSDDLKTVIESQEGNNCRASATQVAVGRPDLVTSTVTNPPAQTAPGRTFTLTDTVANHGGVNAAASTTRYYLSLNAVKDAGDVLLTGTRAVGILAPSATSSAPRSVTVPATTPTGTYRVLACADDLIKVTETNESNNCAASSAPVEVLYPDLLQTAVSNPPASRAVGGTFSVTDTVSNSGAIATPATSTRYYFSTNTVRDAGDVLLTGTRGVASIPVGGWNTGSRIVTIPTIASGTYYLLACADDTKLAIESDESNNCRVAATTIAISP